MVDITCPRMSLSAIMLLPPSKSHLEGIEISRNLRMPGKLLNSPKRQASTGLPKNMRRKAKCVKQYSSPYFLNFYRLTEWLCGVFISNGMRIFWYDFDWVNRKFGFLGKAAGRLAMDDHVMHQKRSKNWIEYPLRYANLTCQF